MENRLEKLRAYIKEQEVDGMLITSQSNRRYMTGFTGSSGYVLITQQEAIFITDFRYIEQAKDQAKSYEIVQHKTSIVETLKEHVDRIGIKKLGFEKDTITFALFKLIEEKLIGISLMPLSLAIENIRMYKDSSEIETMRKAAEIADSAFDHILHILKPGVKEIDIALELEYKMKKLGAEKLAFDSIVASGYRSALPHGIASNKVIEDGDFVTMDFGAVYNGYCSDITRTVIIGKANEKQKEIYNIVLEAQLEGVNNIKAGMLGSEADALTRDIIAKYGYGDYFGHGTGHGVGLDVHESPTVSPRGDIRLKPGMVVTVEPGIYIPDFGGVRIEDDVLITDNGREILTNSKKDLIIID